MGSTQTQMAELQRQIDALTKQADARDKADSGDPQVTCLQALRDHTTVVANAHPGKDYTAVVQAVSDLPEDPTTDDTAYVRELIQDHQDRYSGSSHDWGYVASLAKELHLHALKSKTTKQEAAAQKAKQDAEVENEDDE